MKRFCLLLLAAALAGCGQSHPGASEATPTAAAAAATIPAAPTPAASPEVRESLPRTVAGLILDAPLADVEKTVGALDCHENPQGFRVCVPKSPPANSPAKLEIYLVHDRVVSLAYESDVGENVWDFLSGLIKRYGPPSLNGVNEKDIQRRTHEIYGWKDDRTLYSVRFIWIGEGADRKLTTTAITLWDRQAYKDWEAETRHKQETTPTIPPALGEPT